MDNLKLSKHFKLQKLIETPNIAEMLPKVDLEKLGDWAVENFRRDLDSRADWEERNVAGMKLAMQVVETKSFPWINCSNVKFPLLTIAALQFLARISIITKGRRLVSVEFAGADPRGEKTAICKRISEHMSLQLTEDFPRWASDDEKLKFAVSIVGSGFKKTYTDLVRGINISEYVPASRVVVDYYCKDIDEANRITHVLSLNKNKIQERVRQGLFLELQEGTEDPAADTFTNSNVSQIAQDEASGIAPPSKVDEFTVLEQHCWYDFDGDGYAEPYIMFVRLDTAQVLRIVARYLDTGDVHRMQDEQKRALEFSLAQLKQKGEEASLAEQSALERQIQALEDDPKNHIVRIDPMLYFTQYVFIPSPDNGFYGLGLGSLLGPTNESVNTLVNQLIDAGTMANSGGGFLGRGVKLKGGKTSFDPFEWKPVDSTGDDLRKSIFPLPVREPSTVLFQLLQLLITYSEKVSGATDIMTGVAPGQNTPAETTRSTVEQGMMLFSGIYTRMYRSFQAELRKLYKLNQLYLQRFPSYWDLTQGPDAIIGKDDYNVHSFRVFPAADATAVSASQRKEKAAQLLALSNSVPGFDKYAVMRNYLEACEYTNIEEIYPKPGSPKAPPPQVNPKVALEQAKLQQKAKEHQDDMQLAIAELKQQAVLNQSKIAEQNAKATKLLKDAEGAETGRQIAMINAEIGAAKVRQEGILRALDALERTQRMGQAEKGEGQPPAKSSPQQQQQSEPAIGANSGDITAGI